MDKGSPTPGLVLVVPCYNESKRLPVQKFLEFVNSDFQHALTFVDDGSTDGTLGLLRSLQREAPENIDVVELKVNRGKGEAVRRGILAASSSRPCDLMGYWDADLSTPLSELHSFVEALEDPQCQLVSGARVLRMGGNINRRWYRHYLGRIFATGASLVLGLPYYDTQCGAKLFRRRSVNTLFDRPFLSSWLFDIELIFRLKAVSDRERLKTVFYEVPLTRWRDAPGSKVSFTDFLKAPYELFRIWRRYA